jgi:hypothetical protein
MLLYHITGDSRLSSPYIAINFKDNGKSTGE